MQEPGIQLVTADHLFQKSKKKNNFYSWSVNYFFINQLIFGLIEFFVQNLKTWLILRITDLQTKVFFFYLKCEMFVFLSADVLSVSLNDRLLN